MRFLSTLFFLFYCLSVNSLVLTKAKRIPLTITNAFESVDFSIRTYPIVKKTKALVKTMRVNNILPTIVLCFAGGFIVNPTKLKSAEFFASTFITLLVMSNSMIINDIFDMPIDRINNPSRPLVSGELSRKEATAISFAFFVINEILNIKYIPRSVQLVPHIANLLSLIYTPILKHIPYLKNITCALLISFSVFFSGLSIQPFFVFNKNTVLLSILSSMIFVGSWTNEILLDITDKEGDKQNNIITLPILYGNECSIDFVKRIYLNVIIINAIILRNVYTITTGLAFLFINMNFLTNLETIKNYNYETDFIKYTVKSSIKTLCLVVLYMCILRRL